LNYTREAHSIICSLSLPQTCRKQPPVSREATRSAAERSSRATIAIA